MPAKTKSRGPGRPPKEESARKKPLIGLRVTRDEYAELQAAAARDDRSLSQWLRKLGLDAARAEKAG